MVTLDGAGRTLTHSLTHSINRLRAQGLPDGRSENNRYAWRIGRRNPAFSHGFVPPALLGLVRPAPRRRPRVPRRFATRRSSFVARRGSFVACRLSFSLLVVRRSSSIARRSLLVACRASFPARRGSFVVRRSPFAVFDSAVARSLDPVINDGKVSGGRSEAIGGVAHPPWRKPGFFHRRKQAPKKIGG